MRHTQWERPFEREISLVLTCRVTAAFCVRALDVCAQKTVYQKFKLIWH